MKKILTAICVLVGHITVAQYNPSNFTVSNKSYGVAQAVSTDARSWFYDATNFVMRDYQSTTEVNTYLNLAKYRSGHFPIFVHSGGTLTGGGVWIGGTTLVYWYKDSTGNANLVRWYTDSISTAGFFVIANNLSEGNPTTIKTNLSLDQVNNTSDVTKNSAAVSLTNHTIDGSLNSLINIGNGSLVNSTIGLTLDATGTDVGVTSSPAALGSNIAIHIPTSSVSNRGVLSSSDWISFRVKVDSTTESNDSVFDWHNGTPIFRYVVTSSGSGITLLNGLSSTTQLFAVGSSGSTPNISSVSNTHTFNFPVSGPHVRGVLDSTDWVSFNGKLSNITGLVTAGTNITVTGSGTGISPYVITATAGSGINQLNGDVTAGPGIGNQTATLANTAVTAGTYTNATVTFDSKGRATSASNGSPGTNSNIGSGYRWAVPGTNNIKTAFPGFAELIDSTSNTNGLTFKFDSTAGGGFHTQGYNDFRYLQTISGITAGGDLTGTYPNPTIGANKVTLAKQATNTANTLQGFDGSGNAADVTVGTGLSLSGGTLSAVGGSQNLQQVTTVGANTTIATHFDSTIITNALFNEGVVIGDTLSNFTDSTLFVGNSIFYGFNASSAAVRATTLTAQALGSFEINKGVPGTTLAPGSGNSIFDRLSDIYHYRTSLRFLFIELTTNDRGTDTTTLKGYYNTLLDTVIIARGWPASRVILLTPGMTGIATLGNIPIIGIMIKNLAASRGMKCADVYTYQLTYGGLRNVSSDSLHPTDLGHLNMKKAMLYALGNVPNAPKTNGNLLVNGNSATMFNNTVGGYGSYGNTLSITTPTINTPSITIYSAPYFGGGQYNEVKFNPSLAIPQNDSFSIRTTVQSGYRIYFDLIHNGNSVISVNPTNDAVTFGNNGFGYPSNPKLGVNGGLELNDHAVINTPGVDNDMLRLTTGLAASPGQYNNISIIGGNSTNDSFAIRYEVGGGYHNNLQFMHNGNSIWRLPASTSAIPFQFDVPNIYFASPTTSFPSLNLPAGTEVTAPSDGDFRHVSGHLYFNDGSHRYDLLAPGGTSDTLHVINRGIGLLTGNTNGLDTLWLNNINGLNSIVASKGADSANNLQLVNDSAITSPNYYYGTNSGSRRGYYALPTGLTTVTFSGTANSNGGSISGSTLTLSAADGTHPGGVSTSSQVFGGAKEISGQLTADGGTQTGTDHIRITGDLTGAAQGGNGNGLFINSYTFTDNSSSTGNVATNQHANSILQPTFAASNTGVVYTGQVASLAISGPPIAGTNITINNPWSLYVASGNSFFGGNVNMNTLQNYPHTIFTPSTGGTVALVSRQYNIINPSGSLLALTVNLPSSPANNDVVYIKYTQAITTVTYGNGTVVDGITSPISGGLVILTFDSGTSSWF